MNRIQVCCRIRDCFDSLASFTVNSKSKNGTNTEILHNGTCYVLDNVFDGTNSQAEIFQQIVSPLISESFHGFNCSLFSYGQTGSGKTHTLIGDLPQAVSVRSSTKAFDSVNGPAPIQSEQRGIIPRAAELLFETQNRLMSDELKPMVVSIRLSVLEIYQEKLRDLLPCTKNNWNVLRIREQLDGSIYVEGLTEFEVLSTAHFTSYLDEALKKRVVGSHSLNDVSSRSHLVVIVTVLQHNTATKEKTQSKLHFIDLAGSEMVRKTDTTGVRFSEAKHINKSLSALGNVINALSNSTTNSTTNSTAINTASSTILSSLGGTGIPNLSGSVKIGSTSAGSNLTTIASAAHIPYRDSKLTRLLQNSLGGNAKTVIMLTISADKAHTQESLSTLKFGDRARTIVTKPQVNKTQSADEAGLKRALKAATTEISLLKQTIVELQTELYHMKNTANNVANNRGVNDTVAKVIEDSAMLLLHDQICSVCQTFLHDVSKQQQLPTETLPNHQVSHRDSPLSNKTMSGVSKARGGKPVRARSFDTLENLQRQSSQRQIDALSAQHVSEPPNTAVADNDPVSDYCAICLLNSDQTDQLLQDTGEALGELFTCDGNCGDQFHVRCVGLVGDGGQFALPEGEWYCTACSVDIHSMNSAALLGTDIVQPTEDSVASNSTEAKHSATPAPNPTLLATLQTEYHTMRKERNRILSQWQTEKRIQKKLEQSRTIQQQQMDAQIVSFQDTNAKLKLQLAESEKENARLKQFFESFLATGPVNDHSRPQSDGLSSESGGVLVDSSVAATMTFIADSNKWSDLLVTVMNTSDAAQNLPVSPQHHSRAQPQPCNSDQLKHHRVLSGVEASLSNSNTSTVNCNIRSDYSPSIDTNNNTSATDSTLATAVVTELSLPKPWKQQKDSSGKVIKTANPHLVAVQKSFTTTHDHSTDIAHTAGDETTANSIDGVYSQEAMPLVLKTDQSTTTTGSSSISTEKSSKFINPLKNRLTDLLKSVQDEAGSFAEIREKYRTREDERVLRNSVDK